MTPAHIFSYEIWDIFGTFFYRTSPVAASGIAQRILTQKFCSLSWKKQKCVFKLWYILMQKCLKLLSFYSAYFPFCWSLEEQQLSRRTPKFLTFSNTRFTIFYSLFFHVLFLFVICFLFFVVYFYHFYFFINFVCFF